MEPSFAVRQDAVSWTPTDDGQVVLLDLQTSRYLSLNASAARLWTQLADGATKADLVTDLTASYGLSSADAERDVSEFLSALTARRFIEVGADG